MNHKLLITAAALLFTTQTAMAGDLPELADCTIRVFSEINKTRKWSGKAPAGCNAAVAVEKRQEGVFVAAWRIRSGKSGWVRTALSAAAGFGEIAVKRDLERATKDIRQRAARLERCLESINTVNDPLECRDHATKSYLAGEVSGTENQRLIWLDDNGRHVVAGYASGSTSATPAPPAELFSGERLPPGIIIVPVR